MSTSTKSPWEPLPAESKPVWLEPAIRVRASPRSAPSIVSADVKVIGSIVSEGDLDFNGAIEGDIRASVLTMGETSFVKGELIAETVVVSGNVEGRIRGRKVQLCAGAKMLGEIAYASLAIESSAVFEGTASYSLNPMAELTGGSDRSKPTSQRPDLASNNG